MDKFQYSDLWIYQQVNKGTHGTSQAHENKNLSTYVMVFSVQIGAAALADRDTLAVAQDEAAITLTTFHTGGWRQVANKREEVGASGWAWWGALRVVAVRRAGYGCGTRRQDVKRKTLPPPALWLKWLLLTTEGAVPPADGDAGTLACLGVCLHIVAECGIHAVVLAHVEHTGVTEDFGVHQCVAGLEAVRHDDIGALGCVQLLLTIAAVRVKVWAIVWLTAGGGGETSFGSVVWMMSCCFKSLNKGL